ncbi:acyl-CoA dehydrogenase family protein [Micromonospora sp. NBC_01813]|uniref:acyl-CoA dehydrogenase family protein n=1 Tax=Micromonospora sp. NBC_01813 TaxID=2975988 RepID=UPI002DD8429E|nr:acyl-CoA dehydrogenase family protein [Micromonospora sp. NBC_01813]WSA12886.1 acyl-CoA dehydrogenase family protein [Micromonospora sp. NBC_01813]
MSTTEAPLRTEAVRRATELAPTLRNHSLWTEANRRLHEESLEALTASGLLRLRAPARYGGNEGDSRTMVDVCAAIGRGDGSAAWTLSVWYTCGWMACMFSDEAQDEVFANPDARVCGVLSPTAVGTPKDGGLVVNGSWHFVSGALHSDWQVIVALVPAPNGQDQIPMLGLVPVDELEIVDDWHVAGLKGTGSVTTVAKDVFVPEHRLLSTISVLQDQYASVANANRPVYQTPLMPVGCASFIGTAVGLAQAARDNFLERLPSRGITYTAYESQSTAPITHLQVAQASLLIDEVEFHARRVAQLCDTKESWTLEERVRTRASTGRAFQLTKSAVDLLNTASGGSSVHESVPIQRIERDVQTMNLHALMHPNTTAEVYGRVLCGLEPNTPFI